jgi:TP901 family phage tail tape measure protein
MAKGFNLTAEINLRGPANIKQVVKSIKQQLGTINANVNININSSTTSAINQINNRLNNLNQTLAATTTSANTAAQAFSNLAAAMNSVAAITLPPTVTANVNQTTTAVTNASRAVAQTRTEFEEFGRQSALAVRRFAAFSSVTSIIYGLNNAISAGISDFITFDKQITRLSQVTNESKDGLSSLAANITRLSTGLGVASKDLAEVSVTLAQAGLSASDTRTALEALAKSALAPSFDSLNETVEGSIALMRQFGISAAKLEGALGSVNAVAAAFAVEASDIITAIQRTGGVFASASKGVSEGTDSLNEFIAVFTSVRATTRESAETIATGLRTIFTRIQRADTVEALKEFGVTLTDLEGKFVGPYEAVRRLSEGLSSIDPRDLKFSQIVEELGGFRQIGKVLPLIQQFSTAQSALKIAQEGQGSLAIDAAKGQQALAVQIQKVREEFSALIRSFGDSSSFQTLVKLGLDLASALIKVADATKGVLPLVGLIAAFRGVSAITQFAGGFGQGIGGGRRQRANMGGVIGFADGGVVPGSGRGDKVPAMLEPGEVVMSNRAVRQYGRGNLVRMNKYAGGGIVSDIGGVPGSTKVQNDKGIVGFKNDTYNIPSESKSITIVYNKKDKKFRAGNVEIDPTDVNSLWRNDPDAFSTWETIVAKVYNAQQINDKDPNYPIDIIKGSNELFDAKFRSEKTYSEKAAAQKALSYRLEQTGSGFRYNAKNKTINLSKFLGQDVTMGQDDFKDPGSITFVFPKFKNIPVDLPQIQKELSIRKAQAENADQEGAGYFAQQGLKAVGKKKYLSGDKELVNLVSMPKKTTKSLGGKIQRFASGGPVKFNGTLYPWSEVERTATELGMSPEELEKIYNKRVDEDKMLGGRHSSEAIEAFRRAPMKLVVDSAAGRLKDAILSKTMERQDKGKSAEYERRYTPDDYAFNLGGLIQKFAGGAEVEKTRVRDRVSSLAQTKQQSISETILEQLKGLGGPAGVRQILGIPPGDSVTRSVLNASNIKVNKNLDQAKDYVNRALFTSGKSDAAEAKRVSKLTQVAMAGLVPIDYNDTFEWELPESKKTIFATIKGFNKRYLAAAQQMSRETAGAARNLAENMQYTDIFTGEKLAFDFDETLVAETDILGEDGKPDIPKYYDRKIVAAALAKGRLTRLGIKLKTLIEKDPEFIKQTRILTARPAETVDLLANTLQRLGLPYSASDITGVGGANIDVSKAKAVNLAKNEKLIDDSLNNINAVTKSKKSGFLYTEPKAKPELDELMGQGNIEGAVIEKALAILGANLPPIESLEANRAIDFPTGLGRAAQFFNLDPNMPTEVKRTLDGSSFEKARKEFDRFYVENPERFASGGSVPALLTPGEAVIGPKLAKKIGYAKLNRMNKADQNGMGRYASGGSVGIVPGSGNTDSFGPVPLPVGSFVIRKKATEALGFNSGGKVKKFFFGGSGGPSPRPTTISPDTLGASNAAVDALRQVSDALAELGVTSTQSAQLLNRGYQATAAEARRATEADLAMARAVGASADVLFDLEEAAREANRATQAEINIRQRLGDISGGAIQDAITAIEDATRNARETERTNLQTTTIADASAPGGTRLRTEEEVTRDLRAGEATRREAAINNVAFGGGLGTSIDLSALGATGEDLSRIFQSLSRDSSTLREMDARYLQVRRQSIDAELAAGRITVEEANRQRSAIEDEIRARRSAIEQSAQSSGARGPNDRQQMDSQQSTMRNLAIITVGSIIADNISAKTSAMGAGISGAVRGASQSYGITSQLTTELDNVARATANSGSRFTRNLGGLAGKVGGFIKATQWVVVLGQAAVEAYNAIRTYAIELEKNKIEQALDGIADQFDKLSRDLSNINLRNQIQTDIIDAARAAERLRQKNLDTSVAGLINGFDLLFSSMQGAGASRQSAVRGQVLEKEGIIEYLKLAFGNADAFEGKAAGYARTQGAESAQAFKPVADNVNQLITARIKGGENVNDILAGGEFRDFAASLVYADAALNKQIRAIEISTRYTEDEKRARIEEIISIQGANKIRAISGTAQREVDQKDLGASISIYTRSLKRMFTNMEQAINAAAYSLRQMTDNIDLASAAIQGQAKVGNIDLETSNVIQNPRSYDKGRVSAAQTSAASLFGSRGADMTKLMNLGETVESTVMSTINKTLESKGPDASNEAIARSVDTAVRDELKGLGLPPELADKLAKEVGSTLTDLRSNRDEKIDFSKLSEKIAGLNSIIDTAKDAQQIAIKALENYQNALNAYTNNVNRIIDLETSARDKQNRAMDITADASLSLAKSLNRTITVSDAFAKRDASVSRRTGGLTDPTDIFNKIEDLNSTRGIQQDTVRQTAERGPSAAVDFIKFNTELKNTSIALRENKAALEEMANNTTKASAAMDAIQEAQQKAAGRVGFLEKVVTSTPEELESLNQSLYRLQRNANGQQNSIQNSIGAQKAYTEAINNGASATEAMKAAQTAFATERKDTLGTLQDILPFLGDNQAAGNVKANVLESMLKESGMGVSPVFQQILNTLRNPEQDPATASAIQYYNQAIAEQSAATRLLGQLDQNLANDIAQKNTDLLLDGLTKTKLNFENSELSDISKNVNAIVSIIRKDAPAGAGAAPAAPIATGGMVYASAGQFVNFQPQGTDTVPAMLTPGEFVINRRATQANLPLLESINNSYSKGGSVKYYAAGGYVSNYGDAGKMADAGMVTKLPIIDPFPAQNAEIWNIGLGQITKLPNTYTVSYPAPPKNSLPTKRGFALDNGLIQPGRGEVRLGLMPGIAWDGDYTYSYKPMQAYMNKILSPTIVKAKNTDVYLGQQSFGSGKKVSKSEAEKIKERFGSFTSITTPQRKMQYDPGDYDSDPPEASDFNTPTSLSANFWNPNIESSKNYGLKFENALPINTDNPSITDPNAHGYKIWKYQRSWFNPGELAGSALAVSVNQPEFEDGSPYADRKGSDFKVYTQGADQGIIFPSLTNNDSQGIIRGSKIKESNEINDANYDLYKNTLEFLNDRAEYVDDGSGQGLQKLLAGFYNGTESHITLAGNLLDPFDELKAKGARTAIIAQQTLEQSFRNAAENISSNPRSSSEIKIGLTGGKPAAAKDEVMLDKPFTLKEDVVGAIDKSFPLMINGDMNLLGQDFKEAVAKAAMNKSDKISSKFFTDNLKLTLPIDINGNKPSIDVPISYEEYTGELFDTTTGKLDGKQFQTYLPTNRISKTLFSKLDTTNRRLFTPKKYDEPELLKAAAGNVDFDAIKDLMQLEINKDPSAEAQRERVAESANLVFTGPKSSLIKYTGMVGKGGADVFTGTSDEPVKVNIGEILLSKLEEARSQLGQASGKVDQSAGTLKKGAVLGDTELRDATSLLIRGSLGIFSRLPMPGYPSSWLYNSGAREALRYTTNAVPVRQQSGSNYLGAARHMAGVFNIAGEYLSGVQNRATNVQTYNVLDNVMTMISGAQGAFSAIAGGDTALLKQFYDSKTPIEAVFRSFGAASRFGKVSGMKLSGDWKNTLGNQLNGTRIRTVGRDGRLTDSTVAEAIPESANVTDLMKVLFNPYNEFQEKSSRATLIRKFGDDLFNLRNESGMPYFDKNTLAFIRTGLFRLIDWYGGQGNWVGQDYFFDKTNEPDNAKRMETFLESYKTDGSKLYKDAMEAQTLFGLANAFGPLPTASWFMSRSTAEEPQRRATGGIIYAQDGGGPFINFTPRGTDTVPAMLTPGEFVVNRAATQRNLPLLRAMNAGGNVKSFSQGGVAYLAGGTTGPIDVKVTGNQVGTIPHTEVAQTLEQEAVRAQAKETVEKRDIKKGDTSKLGSYKIQQSLINSMPKKAFDSPSVVDFIAPINVARNTKSEEGLDKVDVLKDKTIDIDDLTQYLSIDKRTQETINPYLKDDTSWLWKFNIFSPDIPSGSRKTDASKEIQPDIRNLSPRLDAWSDVIRDRLDTAKQEQTLKELKSKSDKVAAQGGRGATPEKQKAYGKYTSYKKSMGVWKSKTGEYQNRLSGLEALISLRDIGGGAASALDVAEMKENGGSKQYNETKQLGLPEDVIDEGVKEGTRRGLRNLAIGAAIGVATPFLIPAAATGVVALGAGLLIGGGLGIGSIMTADAIENKQYQSLRNTDPEEFAKQELLRKQGSYQDALSSVETAIDIADVGISLGGGLAVSKLAKKSRFFRAIDNFGRKPSIATRPNTRSTDTSALVGRAKESLRKERELAVKEGAEESTEGTAGAAAKNAKEKKAAQQATKDVEQTADNASKAPETIDPMQQQAKLVADKMKAYKQESKLLEQLILKENDPKFIYPVGGKNYAQIDYARARLAAIQNRLKNSSLDAIEHTNLEEIATKDFGVRGWSSVPADYLPDNQLADQLDKLNQRAISGPLSAADQARSDAIGARLSGQPAKPTTPAGAATPPAGTTTPPAGATTPPAGASATTPPAGATTPPAGTAGKAAGATPSTPAGKAQNAAAKQADEIILGVKEAAAVNKLYEETMAKLKAKEDALVRDFFYGTGTLMEANDAAKALKDNQAYKDALANGSDRQTAMQAAFDNDATLKPRIEKTMESFDLDDYGNIIYGDKARDLMKNNVKYRAKYDYVKQQILDDVSDPNNLTKNGIRSRKARTALAKKFDDPNINIRGRTWAKFVTETMAKNKKRKISSGLGLLGLAALFGKIVSWERIKPDPGEKPKEIPEPVDDTSRPELDGSGEPIGPGPVVPPIVKEDAAKKEEQKKQIIAPDYYDELTYKEFVNRQIAAGNSPPPPDKKRFTTAAVYTAGPDGQRFRTTAYDQRSPQAKAEADGRGKRDKSSQMYGTTAPFTDSGLPQDIRNLDKDKEIEDRKGRGEFVPSGSFGENQNTKEGNRGVMNAAGLLPAGSNIQDISRHPIKMTGRKGIESQYKSAYSFWRTRLGEYNYHQSIGRGNRYAAGHRTTTTLANRMYSGGVVYASNGMMIPYEPRGSDTVPAMLTPGEFVVNRAATQKNLPLLHSINNGQQFMSNGGIAYLAIGGMPSGLTQVHAGVQKKKYDAAAAAVNDTFDRRGEPATQAAPAPQGIGAAVNAINDTFGDRSTATNGPGSNGKGRHHGVSYAEEMEGIKNNSTAPITPAQRYLDQSASVNYGMGGKPKPEVSETAATPAVASQPMPTTMEQNPGAASAKAGAQIIEDFQTGKLGTQEGMPTGAEQSTSGASGYSAPMDNGMPTDALSSPSAPKQPESNQPIKTSQGIIVDITKPEQIKQAFQGLYDTLVKYVGNKDLLNTVLTKTFRNTNISQRSQAEVNKLAGRDASGKHGNAEGAARYTTMDGSVISSNIAFVKPVVDSQLVRHEIGHAMMAFSPNGGANIGSIPSVIDFLDNSGVIPKHGGSKPQYKKVSDDVDANPKEPKSLSKGGPIYLAGGGIASFFGFGSKEPKPLSKEKMAEAQSAVKATVYDRGVESLGYEGEQAHLQNVVNLNTNPTTGKTDTDAVTQQILGSNPNPGERSVFKMGLETSGGSSAVATDMAMRGVDRQNERSSVPIVPLANTPAAATTIPPVVSPEISTVSPAVTETQTQMPQGVAQQQNAQANAAAAPKTESLSVNVGGTQAQKITPGVNPLGDLMTLTQSLADFTTGLSALTTGPTQTTTPSEQQTTTPSAQQTTVPIPPVAGNPVPSGSGSFLGSGIGSVTRFARDRYIAATERRAQDAETARLNYMTGSKLDQRGSRSDQEDDETRYSMVDNRSGRRTELTTKASARSQLASLEENQAESKSIRTYVYDKTYLKQNNNEILPTLIQVADTAEFNASNGPKALKDAMRAIGFNTGGVVYASEGQMINFEPRGTDTVPAMLTPGEFVINRAATQKNLPLLKAINSGKAMSKGGVVYLAGGGIPTTDAVASALGAVGSASGANLAALKQKGEQKAAAAAKAESDRQAYNQCVRDKKANLEAEQTTKREQERAKKQEKLGPANEDDEERAATARQNMQDYNSALTQMTDAFMKESLQRENTAMEETGLGRTELYANSPRFAVEAEFKKKQGNIKSIDDNDDIRQFLGAVEGLSDVSNNTAGIQNIYGLKPPPSEEFYAAAGVSENYMDKYQKEFSYTKPDATAFEARKTEQRDADAMIRRECADLTSPEMKNMAEKQIAGQEREAQDRQERRAEQAQTKSRGGIIYASTGTLVNYEPRGTDTVPAMLTPGEFVVNRQAAQKNLPLLETINSGAMSAGGKVLYAEEGIEVEEDGKKKKKKGSGNPQYDQRQADRQAEYGRTQARARANYDEDREAKAGAAAAANQYGVGSEQHQAAYQAQRQSIYERKKETGDTLGYDAQEAQAERQQQQQQQGGVPQISQQVQQAVGQASRAAFDPSSYGDVNKQMVIFGTLLTGVNQVMVQFGTVMQQLTANMGGVNNNGGRDGGGGGEQGGLADFTTKFENLVSQLNGLKIPEQININVTHQPLQVNVTGAEAMKALLEGPFQEAVKNAIKQVTTDKNVKNEQSPDE